MADSSDRYVELTEAQASDVRRHLLRAMEVGPSLTAAEVRRRGKVSQPTLTDLLSGKARRYWRSSLRKASVGVGWTPTSIEFILNGGDPVMADESGVDLEARVILLETEVPRLAAELRRQADVLERLIEQLGLDG